MARYALNLPAQLKQDAENWAAAQGVSLNQFILWAVAEKVGSLGNLLDDPEFPQITYRRGGSGLYRPAIRGTGIHVKAIVGAVQAWEMTPEEIADEYEIPLSPVQEALAFYEKHRREIDIDIAADADLAAAAERESMRA
jgi:uncharacterized protein (DUF433 family)